MIFHLDWSPYLITFEVSTMLGIPEPSKNDDRLVGSCFSQKLGQMNRAQTWRTLASTNLKFRFLVSQSHRTLFRLISYPAFVFRISRGTRRSFSPKPSVFLLRTTCAIPSSCALIQKYSHFPFLAWVSLTTQLLIGCLMAGGTLGGIIKTSEAKSSWITCTYRSLYWCCQSFSNP